MNRSANLQIVRQSLIKIRCLVGLVEAWKPNCVALSVKKYSSTAKLAASRNFLQPVSVAGCNKSCYCSFATSLLHQKKTKVLIGAKLPFIREFCSAGTMAEAPKKQEFRRLPKTVIPKHYELELKPDLVGFKFTGRLLVNVELLDRTDRVVMNALDLDIKRAIIVVEGAEFHHTCIRYNQDQETVTLKFDDMFDPGEALMEILFSGELNDKMKGFYRSKYFTPDGKERYAGVTQFESTDARRCFPCWDEPAIKATFVMILDVPDNRTALSNMPCNKEEPYQNKDGTLWKRMTFDVTPIMSTYLVAVVVGEFDYVEGRSADGVLVRVYTPLKKAQQGLFALEVATKVLPYYKDYFNIAYPLPKMDLIAISDFSAGAMENWGLITYRETFLLVDPENTSLIRKQSIALTVGHEIAHQWFGNLVTMEWWTYLWLNEGYASFVEFLCVDHIFPDYDIWTQFVTDMYTRALELDSLKNSHPVEVPVVSPAEVDEIFDEISYNKGASVIRMLHNWIGEEDFKKGMCLYLTKHQYKNTKTEDLWKALERASHKKVGDVMSTWIKQKGYPIVSVSQGQDGSNRIVTLSQEKFKGVNESKDEENYTWIIPVSFSSSENPTKTIFTTVFDKPSADVIIPDIPQNVWVKVNPGTVGYYRVKYTPGMLDAFLPSIQNLSLPPLDRLGLMDDLFAMVQAGHAPSVQVLRLIEAFENENNYTVWSSISNCLSKLQVLLSHTDLEEQLNAYSCRLYKPIATKLGWDAKPNESHLDTLLRSLVLSRLVSFGCKDTISEAKRRFELHKLGKSLLPADLRSTCYKAVLLSGGQNEFEEMLKLYRATDLHEEKDRISRSLGSIKDVEILKKVVDFAMSDEVRAQDSVFIIVAVAMNSRGRDMTWTYFKDNWQKLLDQYSGGFLLSRLVKYLTENFASEERALEVEHFFELHTLPGTERTVCQSVETIRLNADWLGRDLPSITEYLTKQ